MQPDEVSYMSDLKEEEAKAAENQFEFQFEIMPAPVVMEQHNALPQKAKKTPDKNATPAQGMIVTS